MKERESLSGSEGSPCLHVAIEKHTHKHSPVQSARGNSREFLGQPRHRALCRPAGIGDCFNAVWVLLHMGINTKEGVLICLKKGQQMAHERPERA